MSVGGNQSSCSKAVQIGNHKSWPVIGAGSPVFLVHENLQGKKTQKTLVLNLWPFATHERDVFIQLALKQNLIQACT